MPETHFDVTTLGEMLLRLSVPSGERLESAHQFNVQPAGAEANVVTLLARLERKTSWTGALPNNPLGRLAVNALRVAGVDTNRVIWNETGRMGTYYVEFGEPPRGIQVMYDRAHSCATQLNPNEIDWDSLLDTRLLHLRVEKLLLKQSGEQKSAIFQLVLMSITDKNYGQKLMPEKHCCH